MRRFVHGVFIGVEIEDASTSLGQVITFLGWGSNREIKEKGFRIGKEPDFAISEGGVADLCQFASEKFAATRKGLSLEKNPAARLIPGDIVFTPNGSAAFVITESLESQVIGEIFGT